MAVPPFEIDQISAPNFEIPSHLKKDAIREEQKANGDIFLPELWNERGKVIEYRGTNILRAQSYLIKEVEINSNPSQKWYDSIAYFIPGFILDGVFVEFKSSNLGIQVYKQKIRDSLPLEKRSMDGVREDMTNNDLVLINCSDEKSSEEIWDDSFIPQVKRIEAKRLADSMAMVLERRKSTQVFP
jgi:hypothetical protein